MRSLFSDNIFLSFNSSLFYFRFIFFIMALWFIVDNQKQFLFYFTYSGCFALTFVCLDAIFQYFYGYNFFFIETQHSLRISGIFGSELILGSYVSRLFPIFFGLFLFISNPISKKQITFISFLMIISEITVFISGERVALFNVVVFIVGIIIFINEFRSYRIVAVIISLFLIMYLFNTNPMHKTRLIDRTLSQMGFNEVKNLNIFSERHQAHYISAIKMFIDKPIYGQGPNMFRHKCDHKKFKYKNSCSTHPHQTYLELLSELGLLGFIPFFSIFIFLVYKLVSDKLSKIIKYKENKKRLSNTQISLILSIIITLMPILPTTSFFINNWILGIYYLPLGFILSKKISKQ